MEAKKGGGIDGELNNGVEQGTSLYCCSNATSASRMPPRTWKPPKLLEKLAFGVGFTPRPSLAVEELISKLGPSGSNVAVPG